MPDSGVNRAQFEWLGDKLRHKPTGASFSWSYPKSGSDDVTVDWGRAGDRLENGEIYDREALGSVALELMAEKLSG